MGLRMPYFSVKLEGQDISAWVESVSAVEDDRQADNATVTIPDPRLIYADALFEGSEMEIDMGYSEPNEHALILRAVVTKVEIAYPESGVPRVTLKGDDKSILMGLEQKHRLWRDMKVTDIVTKIGSENHFNQVKAQLTPDPVHHRAIHQDGKTDLQFLQDLAGKYHARCFVELDAQGTEVLYFLPERHIVDLDRPDTPLLIYRGGANSSLMNFNPSFDTSYIDRRKEVYDVDSQGNKVQSQNSSSSAPEVIWQLNKNRMAQASPSDKPIIQALYDKGVQRKKDLLVELRKRRPKLGEVAVDQVDFDQDAEQLESRQLGMTATGTTFGNIRIRAKAGVKIQGPAERWNGLWYVTRVTNRIDASGFKTEFKCVR